MFARGTCVMHCTLPDVSFHEYRKDPHWIGDQEATVNVRAKWRSSVNKHHGVLPRGHEARIMRDDEQSTRCTDFTHRDNADLSVTTESCPRCRCSLTLEAMARHVATCKGCYNVCVKAKIPCVYITSPRCQHCREADLQLQLVLWS